MNASARPVLVRAGSAETLQDGAASLITLLADSAQTQGALTANRAGLRKGSPGAPAHFHTKATEMFFVLGGSLRVLLGDRIVTLETGDFVTVPPRLPHAFAPARGRRPTCWSPSPRYGPLRLLPAVGARVPG